MNLAIAYVMTMVHTVTDRFDRKDEGASAVEYGLLVGLIAAVIIGAVTLLGQNISTVFTNAANAIVP